ncbi:RHS repeat protein [Chitinimonas arctica]|nr:RHS repeat protein [Chitinimonas arctica]
MATIVFGNQLGIPSRQLLAAQDGLGQMGTGIYLNAATGNLAVQDRDELLLGRGGGMRVLRTYNSQGGLDGDNNDNWRIGVYRQVRLEAGVAGQPGSSLIRVGEDGAELRYRFDEADGSYRAEGQLDSIALAGGEWRWRSEDGRLTERYSVAQQGRLTAQEDADGNASLYEYAANGLIGRIQSVSAGAPSESLHFDYQGNQLVQIRKLLADGSQSSRSRYDYDSLGRLSRMTVDLSPADNSVADGQVYTSEYEYDGNSTRLSHLKQSDGSELRFAYIEYRPGEWHISELRDGEGRLTRIVHEDLDARDRFTAVAVQASALAADGSYTVQAGDSWQLIAKRLYGEGLAGGALQTALGSPDLLAGAKLTPPPSLLLRALAGQGGRTSITDPLGQTTRYQYDGAGRLLAVRQDVGAADGSWSRQEQRSYEYDEAGHLGKRIDGQGNTTRYVHDRAGNLVGQHEADGQYINRRYSADHRLLAETRYARSADAELGAAALGQASTRRLIYDAAGHLRFTVGAAGQVVEYRYDAAGQRIAQIAYGAAAYPLDGLAADADPTLAQLQGWQAQQPAAQQERIDYGYDFRGQLASETRYGNGGAAERSDYIYDAAGQLLAKVDPNGARSSYVHDGLGRLSVGTDAGGAVTRIRYDDLQHRISTELADGSVRSERYDGNGQLLESILRDAGGQPLRSERRYYDPAGQLRVSEDAQGLRHWYFYDAAGRKSAEVDGAGTVTVFSYDRAGRLNHSQRYAKAVDMAAAGWRLPDGSPALDKPLTALLPAADAADQHEWWLYDQAGRLASHIDNGGRVTAWRYDSQGRQLAEVHYALAIVTSAMRKLPAGSDQWELARISVSTSAEDRISRDVLDRQGLVLAHIDAGGRVTEYRRDALGRVLEQIQRANTLAPASLLDEQAWRDPVAALGLLPAASGQDLHSYRQYDGKGQLRASLDAEGYLDEFSYDGAGNKLSQRRYANRVTGQPGIDLLGQQRPPASADDQLTLYRYDGNQRLIEQIDADGGISRYRYDSQGRLVQTTRAADSDEARWQTRRYDGAGRLVAELDGEASQLLAAAATTAAIEQIWASRATQYRYDLAGRKIAMRDAEGATTLFYYTPAGQLSHTVNALGEVSANRYNALGQLLESVQYARRIATDGLAGGLADGVLGSRLQAVQGPDDRTIRYAYNGAGQLEATTDALGYVTTALFGVHNNTPDCLLPSRFCEGKGSLGRKSA